MDWIVVKNNRLDKTFTIKKVKLLSPTWALINLLVPMVLNPS